MNINDAKSIAIIDTETNFFNEIMTVGIVIANSNTYDIIEKLYILIDPEYLKPAIFSNVIEHQRVKIDAVTVRIEAIQMIIDLLKKHDVQHIFAYNANFDYSHLPELHNYLWYDIMKIAAYKQYNRAIDNTVDCCCSGRMRSGYGAENIYRMLSGERSYYEVHNALIDAEDELKIMQMLGLRICVYSNARIN